MTQHIDKYEGSGVNIFPFIHKIYIYWTITLCQTIEVIGIKINIGFKEFYCNDTQSLGDIRINL